MDPASKIRTFRTDFIKVVADFGVFLDVDYANTCLGCPMWNLQKKKFYVIYAVDFPFIGIGRGVKSVFDADCRIKTAVGTYSYGAFLKSSHLRVSFKGLSCEDAPPF